VSLLAMSRAAEKMGLHTACGRFTVDSLRKVPLPCILHWNQNHFVVLYKIRKRRVFRF
jgi:ATP-binding cassette subfamily B protein